MKILTAIDFSDREVAPGYSLGIVNSTVAKGLRELADQMENGSLIPGSVEVNSEARVDSFTEFTVIIKFTHNKLEEPKP